MFGVTILWNINKCINLFPWHLLWNLTDCSFCDLLIPMPKSSTTMLCSKILFDSNLTSVTLWRVSVMIFSPRLAVCREGDLTACYKLLLFVSNKVLASPCCSSFKLTGTRKPTLEKMLWKFPSSPLENNFAIQRLLCLVCVYKDKFSFSTMVMKKW